MDADGKGGAPSGHRTRTLAFDSSGRLYVSIGSADNVDEDSFRARIRRFDLNNVTLPVDFVDGEVFADGLRNEVGLAFDRHNVLWGVENGADKLYRDDLGGDIHNDNPAEEVILVASSVAFALHLNLVLQPSHYRYQCLALLVSSLHPSSIGSQKRMQVKAAGGIHIAGQNMICRNLMEMVVVQSGRGHPSWTMVHIQMSGAEATPLDQKLQCRVILLLLGSRFTIGQIQDAPGPFQKKWTGMHS